MLAVLARTHQPAAALPLRPAALASLVAARWTTRIAAMPAAPAALGKPAGARVVLESAAVLGGLPDRELRHRPGHRLAFDARELRTDQRPVQSDFFRGAFRGHVPVVVVNG
jgi:hypothetical protein